MECYSLYLHVPFCQHRCGYCDFNTYAGQESKIPEYVDALCREIHLVGQSAGTRLPAHTIFFGGGTPSLLPAEQFEKILTTLAANFELLSEREWTLEANPGTVSLDYLKDLHRLGFNRISFGMQTANSQELRLLQRQHDMLDVISAVGWARQAGFDNLSLDLIFGLPGQPLAGWQQTVEQALRLKPEHLSLYSLIVEPGTLMQRWVDRGLVQVADEDLAADMYEWASERLDLEGFCQYEISNWARPGQDGRLFSSRHNLQYWRNQPYLGFGAGAHGFGKGYRTANVMGISAFVKRCQTDQTGEFPIGPAVEQATPVGRFTEMQETMMVGLRLTDEGVSRGGFNARFEQTLDSVFGQQIEKLMKQGLLEWAGDDEDTLRLTQRGRLVGNQVFMQFVGD
jgi:oxygen-independent coproporphyrinogen III oxidase